MILATERSEEVMAYAYLLGALALLIFVVAVAWRFRRMSLDIKGMKMSMETDVKPKLETTVEKVEKIHKDTTDISEATNHRLPHELPMVKRIGRLESGQADILKSLNDHRRDTKHWQESLIKTLVAALGIEIRTAQAEQSPSSPPRAEGESNT